MTLSNGFWKNLFLEYQGRGGINEVPFGSFSQDGQLDKGKVTVVPAAEHASTHQVHFVICFNQN